MQQPDITPEIQRRIDDEVRKVEDKIKNTANKYAKRVFEIQISHIKNNPYDYFKLNKPKVEEIYKDLFTPLV